MKNLENKTALVTGGSRGIGRAVVWELASAGVNVFFTYHRNEEAADETAASSGAKKIKCSQTDEDGIEAAVDGIIQLTGRIDILINNAGINSDQFLMMLPLEDWTKVMETILEAHSDGQRQ